MLPQRQSKLLDRQPKAAHGAYKTRRRAGATADAVRTWPRPLRDQAGVTDFRINVALPADQGAATDKLRGIVIAFRAAVGRPETD